MCSSGTLSRQFSGNQITLNEKLHLHARFLILLNSSLNNDSSEVLAKVGQ